MLLLFFAADEYRAPFCLRTIRARAARRWNFDSEIRGEAINLGDQWCKSHYSDSTPSGNRWDAV